MSNGPQVWAGEHLSWGATGPQSLEQLSSKIQVFWKWLLCPTTSRLHFYLERGAETIRAQKCWHFKCAPCRWQIWHFPKVLMPSFGNGFSALPLQDHTSTWSGELRLSALKNVDFLSVHPVGGKSGVCFCSWCIFLYLTFPKSVNARLPLIQLMPLELLKYRSVVEKYFCAPTSCEKYFQGWKNSI